jgi:hypothetical protein
MLWQMQIKAAVDLLRRMAGLPMPRNEELQRSDGTMVPEEMASPSDLLDWLWLSFGFQVPLNEYQLDLISHTIGNFIINFKSSVSDFDFLNFHIFKIFIGKPTTEMNLLCI